MFGGQAYTPVPIEADGWEWRATGQQPQPKLRLTNINNFATPIVLGFGDARGAILTRIRTFKTLLDGQPDAKPGAVFPLDVFRINRKSAHTREMIEWELASPADQAGLVDVSPPGNASRIAARIRIGFRRGPLSATPTQPARTPAPPISAKPARPSALPTTDRRRKLSDCVLRFGQNGRTLPFWGLPGMQRL